MLTAHADETTTEFLVSAIDIRFAVSNNFYVESHNTSL